MNKEYIVSSEKVQTEDDVNIIIKETIPQPDVIKEKTLSVKSIKMAILNLNVSIENMQSQKEELQKILDDNSESIQSSIL